MNNMKTMLEALSNKPHIQDCFMCPLGNGVFFTALSAATGKSNNLVLEITEAQVLRWANGAKIQDAMPQLSADQREYLMTGITSDEWDSLFAETKTSKD